MNCALLKAARISRDKTQEDMAIGLGYRNRSSYCQIENGTVKVSSDTAKAIKEILELTIEEYAKIFLA